MVGVSIDSRDLDANAVQNVDLVLAVSARGVAHQMRERRHRDPSLPNLNLRIAHWTCFGQTARMT
jgi:hypothetical protein